MPAGRWAWLTAPSAGAMVVPRTNDAFRTLSLLQIVGETRVRRAQRVYSGTGANRFALLRRSEALSRLDRAPHRPSHRSSRHLERDGVQARDRRPPARAGR